MHLVRVRPIANMFQRTSNSAFRISVSAKSQHSKFNGVVLCRVWASSSARRATRSWRSKSFSTARSAGDGVVSMFPIRWPWQSDEVGRRDYWSRFRPFCSFAEPFFVFQQWLRPGRRMRTHQRIAFFVAAPVSRPPPNQTADLPFPRNRQRENSRARPGGFNREVAGWRSSPALCVVCYFSAFGSGAASSRAPMRSGNPVVRRV